MPAAVVAHACAAFGASADRHPHAGADPFPGTQPAAAFSADGRPMVERSRRRRRSTIDPIGRLPYRPDVETEATCRPQGLGMFCGGGVENGGVSMRGAGVVCGRFCGRRKTVDFVVAKGLWGPSAADRNLSRLLEREGGIG